MKFNHDPRPYLRSMTTVAGVALRRSVLHDQVPGDWELGNRLLRDIVAAQQRDGSWNHDAVSTGRRLQEMLALDVVCNHPAVELAAEWLQDRLQPPVHDPFPFAARHEDALLSLIQIDRHHEPPVLSTLNLLAHRSERWLPTATPAELAAGIKLLLADPVERSSPTVTQAFAVLRDRAADWPPDDDRLFLLVDVCGVVDSAAAREWLRERLAMLVARQDQDGSWGEWTPAVVRALCLHDAWRELLP